MTARLARLGAALAVSAVTVAGCGALSSPDAPAAPTAKTPQDVLNAAAPTDQSGPYHFTVKSTDGLLAGVVDSSHKTISLGLTQKESGVPFTLDMNFLIIGEKAWTKIKFTPANVPGLPKIPQKWQLLDPSKIKDKDSSPLAYGDDESDPAYTQRVLANASAVTSPTPGHFNGITDLSQVNVDDIADSTTIKALGAKAKTVPFTATVDAKGRLTALTLTIPAAGKTKAHTYAATYTAYDSTRTPGAPAASDQEKAVPAVYDLLNG